MWKWIGGILLVLIVCVMGLAWWGFRKVADTFEPDGSVRVSIAATPARVFASLSDADSAATWMASGSKVTVGRHGPFVPGDPIRVEVRSIGTGRPVTWTVTEVSPGQFVSKQLESPDPRHKFTAIRKDSVGQMGDSAVVISRITTTTPVTDTGEQMMISMFKIQSKLELMSLKARIEGRGSRVRY
jgi:uncharacterized protein YndB with AHSA1/START domain